MIREQEATLARILLETGEPLPETEVRPSARGGDWQRLRGLAVRRPRNRGNEPRHRPVAGATREGTARPEATVGEPVLCVDCGYVAELAERNLYEWRKRGGWRCPECRRPPPKPNAAMRAWWLRRFTRDELVQLAAAIWPNVNDHRGTSEPVNVRATISRSTSSRRT